MTPKQKAIQLYEQFQYVFYALIAIDEIIEALSYNSWQNRNEIMFFFEVKKEIQEL